MIRKLLLGTKKEMAQVIQLYYVFRKSQLFMPISCIVKGVKEIMNTLTASESAVALSM